MSKVGIYPGSFDPITYGHLDIIQRSLHVVDKLIIGIADNDNKTPLLSIEERKLIIDSDIKDYFNQEIASNKQVYQIHLIPENTQSIEEVFFRLKTILKGKLNA